MFLFSGDPVQFIAETPPANYPTKWVAKQVLITDQTPNLLRHVMNQGHDSLSNGKEADDEHNKTLVESSSSK